MPRDSRRIVALMLTDIVGFTAMNQRDEALALVLLGEHNALLRSRFAEYGGEEVKATGDGFLVVFGSPVQATLCALAIQADCRARNVNEIESRRFEIRVALHLGDIVERGGDVLGDAVNVTSRLEAITPPGGIYTTRALYDQVWNKATARFDPLGPRPLRDLPFPIEVFRIAPRGEGEASPPARRIGECRIAVLPLRNTSPDPNDAYFADGMTEELIHMLSRIRGFHVIAQTSAMTYRNSAKSAMQIGTELGVANLLEGSVRKAGDRVRITIQLVDAATEEHVWSQSYDRRLEDILGIQTDIALQIAAALRVRLLSTDETEVVRKGTTNTEAYTAFLRGRLYWSKRTPEALNRAVGMFQRAIELDPQYALAHAGLADSLILLPGYVTSITGSVVYPQAREAALRAIALDETLASPHAVLGLIKSHFEWEPNEGERHFLTAIEREPGNVTAHHWYGASLMLYRRFAESERELRIALSLDPLSLIVHADLGQVFYYSRRYHEAVVQLQETLAIEPQFAYARTSLSLAYLRQGDLDRALEELARGDIGTPETDAWVALASAEAHVMQKQPDKARAILTSLLNRSDGAYISPTHIAFVHLALGETDEAFARLKQAYEDRDGRLIYVLAEPVFDPYRNHPEAIALAKLLRAEVWVNPQAI